MKVNVVFLRFSPMVSPSVGAEAEAWIAANRSGILGPMTNAP